MLKGAAGKNDIDHLAEYVSENQATPPYFDLAEEDAASPQSVAARLDEHFEFVTHKLSDEQIGWMRSQYESSARMKAIALSSTVTKATLNSDLKGSVTN